MDYFGNIVDLVIRYRYEVEAAILALLVILVICLIAKSAASRKKNRRALRGIDKKLENIQSTVTAIREEQQREASRSPINISTEDGEINIRVTSGRGPLSVRTESGSEETAAGQEIELEPAEEPVTEAGSEQELKPEEAPETGVEPETAEGPAEEPEAEPIEEPEAEPVVAPEAEPETETVRGPEAGPETETVEVHEAEPETETVEEPEAGPETAEGPAAELEAEPVVEPEAEPIVEPEAEPVVEPEAVPDEKPAAEPEPAPAPAPDKLVEVPVDMDGRDELDLSFDHGVEPVITIFSDLAAGLDPGEHIISLGSGETRDFELKPEDLLKVFVPESDAKPAEPEQPAEPETAEEPEQPAEPETAEEPEQPTEPEQPAQLETTEEPEQPAEPEAAEEPEPWKVPGWRELSGALDMEFEPIHKIELAFDTPSASQAEEPAEAVKPIPGRRSTEDVREAYESSMRASRGYSDDPYRVVRSFATDKHGNTYTEKTLMDQIN